MSRTTSLELANGRVVWLVAIDQWFTYEGLLLGVPTRQMNQQMMDRLIARYVDPGGYGVPLLLEPEQRPIDVNDRVPPKGEAVALPAVTCVARFKSDGLEGSDELWSVLRLIWFQAEFAFPIDERALAQITAVDWEEHASGWSP